MKKELQESYRQNSVQAKAMIDLIAQQQEAKSQLLAKDKKYFTFILSLSYTSTHNHTHTLSLLH
jgi:hypothetical protein